MSQNVNTLLASSQSYFLGDRFITEFTPATPPKGLFVLLHGFPAWVTKNYDIAEVLVLLGYKVYVPHHQGLGQSKGEFRFTENVDTTRNWLIQLKEQHPNLKLSLGGHSWGGYLSLRNLDLITGRLLLLAPLARFPNDQRRNLLLGNLYHFNKADLPAYTLDSLQEEFQQLEANLDVALLKNTPLAPKTLLLYGTNDEVIPADLIAGFAADVSGPHLEIIVSDADHRLSRRRPVLEQIKNWVARSKL
jgi:alpha-beta hydrolase superfamily lysophospholipase